VLQTLAPELSLSIDGFQADHLVAVHEKSRKVDVQANNNLSEASVSGVFKTIASMALILVAAVCGMFVWGTWNRLGQHWLTFLVSSIVLASCLWAVVRLWRRTQVDKAQSSQRPDFELWLAKKIVNATDVSEEQIAALRGEYERDFGRH
jgi:hypothetical protein